MFCKRSSNAIERQGNLVRSANEQLRFIANLLLQSTSCTLFFLNSGEVDRFRPLKLVPGAAGGRCHW